MAPRFTFTLPVVGEAGATPAPEPGDPPRILVVDDDARALCFVRDARSEAGYVPLVTGAARDLPRIIRTERLRLVLLDLMLPDADGIKLMGQVPDLFDLPVILISRYRRDETVAKALDAGAADYLVKPFSPDGGGPRDDPPPRSPRSPGVVNDPGGLPRDRNTPRIETRRITELQTLGSHETQVPFRQALTAKHEIPGGLPRDWSE